MAWPIFRGLFDDASLFPPASLPVADAVAGHLRHQAAWYCEMSGPFVCADTKITELSAVLTAAGVAELDLALVLPGGAELTLAAEGLPGAKFVIDRNPMALDSGATVELRFEIAAARFQGAQDVNHFRIVAKAAPLSERETFDETFLMPPERKTQ